ncbi:MAG: hypothetical protein HY023_06735, partial [Chloroflexi bacterium]|nr:hypothetical protein [Chloroflexota bacterium]
VLTTGASRPIWDAVPGMQWLQLPTRFLGLASLGAAGLAGAAGAFILQIPGHLPHPCAARLRPALALLVGRVSRARAGECGQRHEDTKAPQGFFVSFVPLGLRGKLSDGLMSALVIAPILGGLPWLYALDCPAPINPGSREIAAATDLPLRATAEGSLEFLPIWVSEMPDMSSFAAEYAAGRAPMRLDTGGSPSPVQLERLSSTPGAEAWQVNSAAGWRAVYRTFYFPGWQATLDGQPAKIEITSPDGLMAVEVPSGAHRLGFGFHPTTIRVGTLIVSGSAWVTVVGLLIVKTSAQLRRQRIGELTARYASRFTLHPPRFTIHVLLLALFALKLLYFDRVNNPIHASRLDANQLIGVAHPTGIDFGGELRHLGYDLSRESVPSGESLTLIQYWTATAKIGLPYGMAVRIADEAGSVWSAPDPPRPFGFADYPGTESWRPGGWARDAFVLDVLPGTPPGTYWLEADAFRRDVVASLLPVNAPVGVDPAFARIGRIEITPGRGTPPIASWRVERTGDVRIADWLTLKGWTLTPPSATVGDYIYLDLLWNMPAKPSRHVDSSVDVWLKDSQGTTVLSQSISISPTYPPDAWPKGAWVRTQARMLLPAHLAGGTYSVGVSSAAVGSIAVGTPQRAFNPPPISSSADAAFGNIARLIGFDLSARSTAPGETLKITLVWHSLDETTTSYRVFVHLRAADGTIVAQSDGVPANWTRPTTGWLAGEFIADDHAISLSLDAPPGEYELVVGLYDPATNVRLLASTGGNEAVLTRITAR